MPPTSDVTSADYLVLLSYMLGILSVGVLLGVRTKTSAEMFAAAGRSPWWVSGLSGFMTMFSAGTFVVWGGIAYKHGMVAVAINACYGVAALLVGYFIAGKWKALGIRSPAQYVELRFSRPVLQFYTWSLMIFRIVGSAVALYALAKLLVALMPLAEGNPLRDAQTGNLSVTWAILIFGGIVVLYTMIGGLWGVLMTDVLQFIVLNLAVLFVVPLALQRSGGISGFVARAPEGFFTLTSPDAGYSWFFLVGWVAIHCFMIGAEWAYVQRFICVPTSADARKSAYLFGVLYLVSPLLWLLPPMIYRTQAEGIDAEQAYILACQAVLPAGMIGLMIAAMFSATASMVSSQLNVFAGALANHIYRPRVRAADEERQLVRAGRLFTLLLGTALTIVALAIPVLGGAEKVIIAVTSLLVGPLLAPPLWALFSRQIDDAAVWLTAAICGSLGMAGLLLRQYQLPLPLPQLDALARWVTANSHTVDLLLGVVLPLVILGGLQLCLSETSAGWKRIADFAAQARASEPGTAQASRMPALVVGWSLFGCAGMMLSLGCAASSSRGVLLGFGVLLAALGVGILGVHSRVFRQSESGATYADV